MTAEKLTEKNLDDVRRQNYFERLDLTMPTSLEDVTDSSFLDAVKKNYKELLLKYHPDHDNSSLIAKEITQALNEAYEYFTKSFDDNPTTIWENAQSFLGTISAEKSEAKIKQKIIAPNPELETIKLCKLKNIRMMSTEDLLGIAQKFPKTAEHIVSNPYLQISQVSQKDAMNLFNICLQHSSAMTYALKQNLFTTLELAHLEQIYNLALHSKRPNFLYKYTCDILLASLSPELIQKKLLIDIAKKDLKFAYRILQTILPKFESDQIINFVVSVNSKQLTKIFLKQSTSQGPNFTDDQRNQLSQLREAKNSPSEQKLVTFASTVKVRYFSNNPNFPTEDAKEKLNPRSSSSTRSFRKDQFG